MITENGIMKLLIIKLHPESPLGCIAGFPRNAGQIAIDSWKESGVLYEVIRMQGGLSSAQRHFLDKSDHVTDYAVVEIASPYNRETATKMTHNSW